MADRDLMKRAGWDVHQRGSHVGTRWDFSAPGKGPMDNNIFASEADAWVAAEQHFQEAVGRARNLIKVVEVLAGPEPRHVVDMMEACTNFEDAVKLDGNSLRWNSLALVLRTMTTFLVAISTHLLHIELHQRRSLG